MADVTSEVAVAGSWVEVSAGLTDNTTYVVDFRSYVNGSTLYWAVVDDARTPPEVTGHPISLQQLRLSAALLEMTPEGSRRYMMRIDKGSVTVVLTEA